MTTPNGIREQAKNTQKEEEKMNARKAVGVVCVLCVLVVGLVTVAVGSSARTAPLPVEYMSWNDLIYDYNLPNNVAPLVARISHEYTDPRQMGGYDPWDPIGNAFAVSAHAVTVQRQWDDDGVPNDAVPVAAKVTLEYTDPGQPGGYDPWDPIGNAFAVSMRTAAREPQQYTDPRQPSGYDPWDPIGNAFGVN